MRHCADCDVMWVGSADCWACGGVGVQVKRPLMPCAMFVVS